MATKPVPGVIYPTQKAPLSNNPRNSAIESVNNMNAKQNALNQIAGFKRCKTYKKGGAVTVPQFSNKYPEQSGPGTGTNSQITKLTQVGAQNKANSQFDSYANKKGGRRSKKAGNPDWHWPCSSGGKKKTRRSSRSRNSRSHTQRKRKISSEQSGSLLLGDFKLKYESKQYSNGGKKKKMNK